MTFATSLIRHLLTLLVLAMLASAVHAHLMVAQHGTINVVDNGAFMVLSVPVSAFEGIDDDGNGLLSPPELAHHRSDIEEQVRQKAQLFDGAEPLLFQGVMLQLSPNGHDGGAASSQIVVLGRYALRDAVSALRLRLRLFGRAADEQTQEMTISRGAEARRIVLSADRDTAALFPSGWVTLKDHLVEGLSHVLGGLDHLLFLLVVMASGWGLRKVVLALSCFTLGHAITLTASALGGLSAPAAVVEPAIAATIVGMALYNVWVRYRARHSAQQVARPASELVRLGLVFLCALIHGLGLAGALGNLGLDTGSRLWGLVGFNLGIELAQLAVVLSIAIFLTVLGDWMPRLSPAARQLPSLAAIVIGSVWFIERVTTLA